MVTLTIDGREVQVEAGKTVLEAADDNNIYIPTLCYHEAVAPYGACRLCVVEVVRRGRERLVASCLYPVEDGLVVKTESERVNNVRRLVTELLLARCPDSEVLQDLASRLGIDKSRFKKEKDNRIARYKKSIGTDFKEYHENEWFKESVARKVLLGLIKPLAQYTWKPNYKKSNWYKFQEAVKVHQQFAKDTILDPITKDLELERL